MNGPKGRKPPTKAEIVERAEAEAARQRQPSQVDIAEFVRLRKRAKLTQEQAAAILRVARSTVASWERGLKHPSPDWIPAIHQFMTWAEGRKP